MLRNEMKFDQKKLTLLSAKGIQSLLNSAEIQSLKPANRMIMVEQFNKLRASEYVNKVFSTPRDKEEPIPMPNPVVLEIKQLKSQLKDLKERASST